MYTITEEEKEAIHIALLIAVDNGNYDVFTKDDFSIIYKAEEIINNLK